MIRAFNPETQELKSFYPPEKPPAGWIIVSTGDVAYIAAITGTGITPKFSVEVSRFNWEPWLIFAVIILVLLPIGAKKP
jgi:hypothetical protein